MNAHEKDEIRELRDYLNRRFMWGVGITVTLSLGALSWAVSQTQTLSATTQVAQSAQQLARSNSADIKQVARDMSKSNTQISALTAQIEAQGRTLERMEGTLAELARYLRDERRR